MSLSKSEKKIKRAAAEPTVSPRATYPKWTVAPDKGLNDEQVRQLHAARSDMLGATLYLVGRECDTGNYVENANPCAMCKRTIINAGIQEVIAREADGSFKITPVQEWIDEDETLPEDLL